MGVRYLAMARIAPQSSARCPARHHTGTRLPAEWGKSNQSETAHPSHSQYAYSERICGARPSRWLGSRPNPQGYL